MSNSYNMTFKLAQVSIVCLGGELPASSCARNLVTVIVIYTTAGPWLVVMSR